MAKKTAARSATEAAVSSPPAPAALRMPSFDDPHLQVLTVCSFLDLTDDVAIPLPTTKFDKDAKFADSGHWIHVAIALVKKGSRNRSVHLHVDLKRSFDEIPAKTPSSTVESLFGELGKFCGMSPRSTWIRAEFRVPTDQLPKGGVIQPFLGLSTTAGGHGLAIRGVSMDIEDEQLDEFRWHLTEDGASVRIILDAIVSKSIDVEYLVSSESFLEGAFRRIVLEEAEIND